MPIPLGPGSGGPFYFAWVNVTDTAFGSAMYVYDEHIYEFELEHKEGQIPTLSITIRNPKVGLLGSSRKQWAWFSWWDGSVVNPLFFGRLVGIPSGFTDEVITLQFIARADDYIARKQARAETLKVAPFYDPIWLDDSHRDEPDAILEAYSASWHVDRLTLAWTTSDILVGEDGTEIFEPTDAFYDALKVSIKEPPLTSLRMNATVKWSQVSTGGSVNVGTWNFQTYSGGSVVEDWPKPYSNIGGGWVVQASGAIDFSGIEAAIVGSMSSSYENLMDTHEEGDTMSASATVSYPVCRAPMISLRLWWEETFAIIWDDFAQPNAHTEETFLYIPQWNISAYLYLEYQANRQRMEKLSFIMNADLQPVLTDPTVQQDSEVVDISSVDLSSPLFLYKDWTVVAGQSVGIGQIIFPNNPLIAGTVSYQICVGAGTAGTVEPNFSNVIGATTTDGSVTWACLGAALPPIPNWRPSTYVALGTLVAPVYPPWIWYSALLPPVYPYRASGAEVAEGEIVRDDQTHTFQLCIIGGTTGYAQRPHFATSYGANTFDGGVQWVCLGFVLPTGAIQICLNPGQTAIQIIPPFSANYGTTVNDNGVQWMSLGYGGPSIEIPAGGTIGNVGRRSYFPTDRGQTSIQYLLMLARAKLLTRSRVVEITTEVPFQRGVSLSCRKNATIFDGRIPGGQASGKIISYALKGDGSTGKFFTSVTIGSAVGNGGSQTGGLGTPQYVVAPGYVLPGYQKYDSSTILLDTNDITYSTPSDNPQDDGLTFPLDTSQVVLKNVMQGSLSAQTAAINDASGTIIQEYVALHRPGMTPNQQATAVANVAAAGNVTIDQVLAKAGNSVYPEIWIKPVTGQQFTTVYALDVSALKVVKLIDLSA